MGDVINLGRARKRKAAERRAAEADANAVRHGRTPAEREQGEAEARRQATLLDGARREPAVVADDDEPGDEPTDI